MKSVLVYAIIVLSSITTSYVGAKGIRTILSEQSQEETGISAPTNFYLWCLEEHKIVPQNFDNYSDWFQVLDDGNTHYFQAHPGDWCYRNGTTDKYTRIEAFEESRFNPGSPWHDFEATYEIDTESAHSICFFQLKSHQNELPQLMCHISNGKLTYQPRGLGARTIATISNKQNFKIKVRCNGDQIQFYYNDGLVYAGVPSFMMSDVENYYRWGIYNNLVQDKYMSVRMTNIKLGVTPSQVEFVSPREDTTITSGYSELYAKVNVSASQSVINSVKLYLDGKFIGQKSSTPFLWGGDSSDVSNPFYRLSVGTHTLKVVAYHNSTALDEQSRLIRVSEESAPYKERLLIPGTFEAEDFDKGADGVSYHDYDFGNKFNLYREVDVDIDQTVSGEYIISNIYPNEWLNYSVEVAEAGYYNFGFLYACRRLGGKLGAEIVGSAEPLFSNLSVPLTRSLNDYQTLTQDSVWLPSGSFILRINFEREGYNLDKIEISKSVQTASQAVSTNSDVMVYPVPSTDGIFYLSKAAKWHLFTITGVNILEGYGTKIDISRLPRSTYILKTDRQVKKLISR